MARRTARSIVSPSAVPIAPRCFPPSRLNQLTWRPSRSRRQASTAVLRCPKTGVAVARRITPPARGSAPRCGRRTRTSSTAPAWRRSPGPRRTRRRGRCRHRSARGWRWGSDAVTERQQRDAGFGGAGATHHVAGDALGGRDRGRGVAEHLADGRGLGGVVERRGRAVRVDVPDLRRLRQASSSASCMHAAAPSPPGEGAVMWWASSLRP